MLGRQRVKVSGPLALILLMGGLSVVQARESPTPAGDSGRSADVLAPALASLPQVLANSPSEWRKPPYELYRWNRFPSVLIFDTISYTFQDRMFARLAFFVEKKGFRGRLLTNADLEGRHAWNAHDYGAQALAAFFNAARASSFPLNPEEWDLLAIALREGVLAESGGRLSPVEGGVLSISRASDVIQRRLLLGHESFHGVFFSSAWYRTYCFHLWDGLAPDDRAFFVSFLDSLSYDSSDRYLAVNEFQAYLMQQPLRVLRSYFVRAAERLGSEAEVAAHADRLLVVARQLDAFLRSRFGIEAGEVPAPGSEGALR